MGSGTTLVAAYNLKRNAIGIDFDTSYCALAKNRIIKECTIYQDDLFTAVNYGK
jgi:DNA modification methylase